LNMHISSHMHYPRQPRRPQIQTGTTRRRAIRAKEGSRLPICHQGAAPNRQAPRDPRTLHGVSLCAVFSWVCTVSRATQHWCDGDPINDLTCGFETN
jgi:hypothetical protein